MAVSISDCVQRVRDILGERPYLNTSTTTTTSTTVNLNDTTGLAEGSILEWQTGTVGYEQIYVQSVNSATQVTALRGYNGTTAETHSSGDTLVRNPLTSGRQIQQHLTNAVNGLWPFVYKTGTVTLTPSSTTVWYDLNALTLGIVQVAQQYGSSGQYVGRFGRRGNYGFEVDYSLPTALVASGKGVSFPSGIYDSSNSILVTDMRAVTGSSDIEDSGQFPVADCVVYTAAGRILTASEIARVSGGTAQAVNTAVPAAARLQTGAFYSQEGKKMLETLAVKYQQFYDPVQMRRL
jgi:hypothetical protein